MSTVNPYQAPKAELQESEDPAEAELATRSQRFGGSFVDGIISMVIAYPLMHAFGLMDYAKSGQPVPFALNLKVGLLAFVFFVLVHGYFLKKNGQTIGKKVAGTRIADLNGDVPGFWTLVALRYMPIVLVTQIPAIGPLLAVVDVLFIFRSDRRCVHDLIAGTKVIRAR